MAWVDLALVWLGFGFARLGKGFLSIVGFADDIYLYGCSVFWFVFWFGFLGLAYRITSPNNIKSEPMYNNHDFMFSAHNLVGAFSDRRSKKIQQHFDF